MRVGADDKAENAVMLGFRGLKLRPFEKKIKILKKRLHSEKQLTR
jgi:hypothetical protein